MQTDTVLDYLAHVTHIEFGRFTPLFICGQRLGYVNQQWVERLQETESHLFTLVSGQMICHARGEYAVLSEQLEEAAVRWRDAGWLTAWRNEKFTAMRHDGLPLFDLERAAFRPLGLTSRAVHINGLCRLPNGEVRMWVARRSPSKAVDPNRMDNMVGGGIAAGETIELALQREGWEEAGIGAARLSALSEVSLIFAVRPVVRGLHREWLHVFDLWLEHDVIPCNQDGEVAEHVLLSLAEVEALIIEGRFMIDAALAATDCLARFNYWGDASKTVLQALHREADVYTYCHVMSDTDR